MKILKYLFLFLIFSVNAQTLTLKECYDLAKQNYPLIKRHDLIAKTKEYNLQNAAKGWLPQIQITGQATYQNDVTQLPIQIPNFTITPVSKDQYKVYADVQQNIYDGGMIANQKKMAIVNSEIELKKTEVETDQLEVRINQIYFGILQTDEQLQQTELTKADITNGLKKAEAQLQNGVIYRSNVDVLKAQLINLEQKQLELQSMKKSFTDMLSVFIHKNIDENTQLQRPEKILIPEENKRAELKLFDLQKQALETQKSFINSKNTPKLGAFFQGGYGKPGFNMLKNEFDIFYIGGLRLNIPISGFYTKKNDLALVQTQQQEIDVQKENFLFNQHFETIQNNNDLQKIQQLINKDSELIALRESIKKASLAQLENGVITTSDYLREVNELARAQNQKIVHEIQYLSTQYNLKAHLNQ
ncbi:TolC family protein [Kaistella flava (ex Peng et al. 2021)]|uniref:TolC family protein n=1 Tax=Kaistella flava (ex Peng et al. 2021) TaxID=2038776 RepID=A0A7M2Y4F6_9FLAO|nr:TolC family protein [Kaistella flava (ex Peng et al. 2021)]QOW09000.1 TolC family protein [Kaistella flava (ex Peng et al. 2021)]